ncbi:MAG: glycosyltransferase, partial [Gemmatimonadales bacterium]
MLISVVVTTYNQPDWLEKVLWSLGAQTDRNFEVLVADDGSGPATRELVSRANTLAGVPVRHVWQEDRGFRKCAILNAAIRASQGDYVVFLDGDCIPRQDFVAVHRRLARPGRFLSGGAFRLPRPVSVALSQDAILTGKAFRPGWLHAAGVPWSLRLARLGVHPAGAALLDALTPTGATFNGGNASAWREDVLAVNGFD